MVIGSFRGTKSLLHNRFPYSKGKPEGALAPSETIIPPSLLREGDKGGGFPNKNLKGVGYK